MLLVRQFEQLWNSASLPPDLFAFLKQRKPSESDQWITILRSDQQRRWQTDKPLKVEDYIAGTPAYMSPEQIRGEGHRLTVPAISFRWARFCTSYAPT